MTHGHGGHQEVSREVACGHDCDHGHSTDDSHSHGHAHEEGSSHGHAQGHGDGHNQEHGNGSEASREDPGSAAEESEASDISEDAATGPLVGGLILRGNRCVLIRSLSGQWQGMRIPFDASEVGESSSVAVVRIVSELCEIETEEVHLLCDVPPVALTVPDTPNMPISVHALYAVSPPPPGPLEAADTEDPEDVYDWYTFPRAMHALARDPYARAALATMACSLAAGAAGGIVPNQWGGVFGQEWTAPAFRLLPGPQLELEEGDCKIDSLIAGSSGSAAASGSPAGGGEADLTPDSGQASGRKRQRVEEDNTAAKQ
mmetsp:Transcript_123745/g.309314  ORF Transcript_123745/g.309314 Transcript_123745/m.309314 type:complete len:316 (+) Transcript_123745:59-1006(+)